MATITHTYTKTETYEEKFSRLINEALEYANAHVPDGSYDNTLAKFHLEIAIVHANQDMKNKD